MIHLRSSNNTQGHGLSAKQPERLATASNHLIPGRWCHGRAPAGTRQEASCTHLRQVCRAAFFWESAGLGGGGAGWPDAVRILCGPQRAPGAPGWGPRAPRPLVVGGADPALGAHSPQALPQRRPAGTRRRSEAPRPMGTGWVPTWSLVLTWLRQSSPLAFASTSTSISTASGLVT